MIEEPPLLTIKRPSRRPTQDQIDAFRGAQTGHVVDAMFGAGALDARISPVGDGRDIECRAVGPALTADNPPADILATSAAMAFLQPGDILVAAAAGHQGCAASGDITMTRAKNAGAVGFVTDGPMRDYEGLVEVGFPVWCTGLTPASPFSNGPGRVGTPVQIGGQRVETGDMIVADGDGVVVVPFDQIDTVIAALKAVQAVEEVTLKTFADGLVTPESMAELLKSDKTVYIDD